MPKLTGPTQSFATDTDAVDATPLVRLGTRAWDLDGNEFVYGLGVLNAVAGSWVSFDEDYASAILVPAAVGRVAVAMAAIVANSYGWYQVYGKNTIAISDTTIVADTPLYIDAATPGAVDDTAAANDWISGAISRSTDSGNVITVELNYPCVHNGAYLT